MIYLLSSLDPPRGPERDRSHGTSADPAPGAAGSGVELSFLLRGAWSFLAVDPLIW